MSCEIGALPGALPHDWPVPPAVTALPYQRLGPYLLVARLGVGGMGEVYRARDTRLRREVALKVLPPHLSADPERRQRLDREARMASQLNHPRICRIYDIGHDLGVDYLVMEYLRGETLAARLERGALPLREVFRLALELAEGLEAAHRAGLVHRDLKPANIMLTEQGAKLLDFGIARTMDAPVGDPEPATPFPSLEGDAFTLTGTVLGSLPYISPEQLQGREADQRSDVFALGATLFEMLTGRRAFEGADPTARVQAILTRRVPPVSTLRPRTPPGLSDLIMRCLEKDPAQRWPDAGALRLELERVEAQARSLAERPALQRRALTRGLWAAVALGVVFTVVWRVSETLRPPPPPLHALIGAPDSTRLLLSGDSGGPPVISPDGTRLAFVAVDADGVQQVWVRPLAGPRAERVRGTEDARFPFWSPDGSSLAFFTSTHLARIDLASGRRAELCESTSGRGGSWGSRGDIVFARSFRSGIFMIPASGGTPREVAARDTVRFTTFRWPHFLPDGRRFTYFAARHVGELPPAQGLASLPAARGGVFLASLDDAGVRMLRETEGEALVAGGHLLFAQSGRLMAQPLDASAGRLKGAAFPTGETVHADSSTWKLDVTVSNTGTLAYDESGPRQGYEVAWFDRTGSVTGKTGAPGDHVNLRLSPDGRSLALETRAGGGSQIWLWALERNTRERLITAADVVMPCWSRDGRAIVYGRFEAKESAMAVYWHPLDGRTSGHLMYPSEDNDWPEDFDPRGRTLLCANGGYSIERPGRLVLYNVARDSLPPSPWWVPQGVLAMKLPLRVDRARISPDGRWFAYTMRENGREEIFLSPFRPPSFPTAWSQLPRRRVSRQGGSRPRWRADGTELFFVRGHSTLVAVPVQARGDSLAFGHEQELFHVPQRPSRDSYDVSADGQRFVIITLGQENEAPIVVISNWLATLERRK